MNKKIVYFDSSLEQDGNNFRTEGYALELLAEGKGKGTFYYDGTPHTETFSRCADLSLSLSLYIYIYIYICEATINRT